jgi:ATP-binding cassette subfamily F protein 3
LLLDEPTNHLDLPSLEWFEDFLVQFKGAIIIVSHDRTFLDRTVQFILELNSSRLDRYTGNYSSYLEQKVQRLEILKRTQAGQQRKIAEMERFIERFRSKATKARQVQSRIKALAKIERIEGPQQSKKFRRFSFPEPVRTGDQVIKIRAMETGYDGVMVLHDIDLNIQRGERIALAGPNGAGKSTLLKVIARQKKIHAGDIKWGTRVTVGYFGQHQVQELNMEQTVLQAATEVAGDASPTAVRTALGSFLFSASDVDKKVGVLSGGEKARLALVRMLLRPAPLLVLDEPTNHLDVESREALSDALTAFKGTLVFVSHDRRFVNSLATHVLDVNDGKIERYEGNYNAYLHQKRQQEQSDASHQPGRMGQAKKAAPSMNQGTDRKLSAKERRREAARLRQDRNDALRPLKKKSAELEGIVEDVEEQLADLDEQLADPAFYAQESTGETFRKRANLADKLEEASNAWLEIQQKIESMEAQFEEKQ